MEKPSNQMLVSQVLTQFRLAEVTHAAKSDSNSTVASGRVTRMLTKGPGLRIGLVYMQTGTTWDEHKTDSRIIVQPLQGRIRFSIRDGAIEMGPGELLVLEPGEPHSVKALDESTFLLTLC